MNHADGDSSINAEVYSSSRYSFSTACYNKCFNNYKRIILIFFQR